jgi:hypothetical protein
VQMWVDILEPNSSAQYVPVDVVARTEVQTGGIYLIKPGYSHRLHIEIEHEAGAKLGIYKVVEARMGLYMSLDGLIANPPKAKLCSRPRIAA